MTVKIKYFILTMFLVGWLHNAFAQQPLDSIDIKTVTLQEIKLLSYDQLLEMPLEQLMELTKRFKLESIEELYELVLNPQIESASKAVEETFFSPMSASVITSEDIELSGVTCIEEALRLATGMLVRQKTNGNFDTHIRGNDNVPPGNLLFDSENTMTLVMINNRVVYNYFQGGTFWETLPIDIQDVERIEIVRGPASSLYGPNAVNGVINIITIEKIENQPTVKASMQKGNANTNITNFAINKSFNKAINLRVSANLQTRERFQDAYHWFPLNTYIPSDSLTFYTYQSINTYTKDTDISTQKQAVNIFGDFYIAPKVKINLESGIQKSFIQSVFLDIGQLALSARESDTKYFSFSSATYGFQSQISYISGFQDNAYGYYGYKFNIATLSAQTEYEWKVKNFSIRPGVSYSNTTYNDSDYLQVSNEGAQISAYFNGAVNLINYATFLKIDYNLNNKLRIIAAVRDDAYNIPKDNYLSFQLMSSYNFNDKHLVRILWSRANRGPFMWDFQVNHYSEVVIEGSTFINEYRKNEDLKLVTTNLVEIGLRNRWQENIFTDLEVFVSKTDNFNHEVNGSYVDFDNLIFGFYKQKENTELVSKQMGTSLSFGTVINSKIQFRTFATIQKTILENFVYEHDTITFDHKSTPYYFGGMVVNYSLRSKFNINTNLYFYGKQEFLSVDGITPIDAKVIANIKVTYFFREKNSIFFNARNVFNSSAREFAFADKIGGLYLFGIQICF